MTCFVSSGKLNLNSISQLVYEEHSYNMHGSHAFLQHWPSLCVCVCAARRYLEMDISLPSDSVHKFADEVCGHLLSCISEVRRLFLVEDMVDTLKVGDRQSPLCYY